MKCRHCGYEIVLYPSATARAKKYGGKPADYTAMFTEHSACAVLNWQPDNKLLSFKDRLRTMLNFQPEYRQDFQRKDLRELSVNVD